MDSCQICGATDDLYEDENFQGRTVYICNRGSCSREWNRDMRDEIAMERQARHDAIDRDYNW